MMPCYFLLSLLANYHRAQKLYFIFLESAQWLYYTVNATLYQRQIDIGTILVVLFFHIYTK